MGIILSRLYFYRPEPIFNDEGVAELAAIFQTNRTVTELNLCNTQVMAKGAETFYKLLPTTHPLRQGLRHAAMKNIYCKEILEKFFSYSLINLMLDYVAEEIVHNDDPLPDKKDDNKVAQPATQAPFTFSFATPPSTQQTPLFFSSTSARESKTVDSKAPKTLFRTPAKKR